MGAKLKYTNQSSSLEVLKLEPIKAPVSPFLAGSKEPFTDMNEQPISGKDLVNIQREAHFRDGERVLVTFETLLSVIPETWRRDTEKS